MAGEDDEDWARAAAELEDAPTRAERMPLDAVPEEVPARDSTGKYKTLPGFEVAKETVEKLAHARGLADGRRFEHEFLSMGFKLGLIALGGKTPAAAGEIVQRLLTWMARAENKRMILVALGVPAEPSAQGDGA